VVPYCVSEKDRSIPRINLMLIQNGERTYFTYMKRWNALRYDQNRHNERASTSAIARIPKKGAAGKAQDGMHWPPKMSYEDGDA